MPLYHYLVLMFVGCIFPVAIFWIFFHKELLRYKKTIKYFMLLFVVSWYILDFLAFRWNVWYLGEGRHIGLWFAGLPLEEWIYVIMVPFSWVTYTLVAKEKIGKD